MENATTSFICDMCQVSISNIPNVNFEDHVINDTSVLDGFDVYIFQPLTVQIERSKSIDQLCQALEDVEWSRLEDVSEDFGNSDYVEDDNNDNIGDETDHDLLNIDIKNDRG